MLWSCLDELFPEQLDVIIIDCYIKISQLKKAPRQGIEPWFSDLESDVLTIERPGISYCFGDYRVFVCLFKYFLHSNI